MMSRRPSQNVGVDRKPNVDPVTTWSNHEYCFTAVRTPTGIASTRTVTNTVPMR